MFVSLVSLVSLIFINYSIYFLLLISYFIPYREEFMKITDTIDINDTILN